MVTSITEIEIALCIVVGFTLTYLFLELAWHFTACRLKGYGKIKPCMFKEIKTVLIAPQTRGGRIY